MIELSTQNHGIIAGAVLSLAVVLSLALAIFFLFRAMGVMGKKSSSNVLNYSLGGLFFIGQMVFLALAANKMKFAGNSIIYTGVSFMVCSVLLSLIIGNLLKKFLN